MRWLACFEGDRWGGKGGELSGVGGGGRDEDLKNRGEVGNSMVERRKYCTTEGRAVFGWKGEGVGD